MKKHHLVLRALMGIKIGLILSSYNQAPERMSPEMRSFYEQLNSSA